MQGAGDQAPNDRLAITALPLSGADWRYFWRNAPESVSCGKKRLESSPTA